MPWITTSEAVLHWRSTRCAVWIGLIVEWTPIRVVAQVISDSVRILRLRLDVGIPAVGRLELCVRFVREPVAEICAASVAESVRIVCWRTV